MASKSEILIAALKKNGGALNVVELAEVTGLPQNSIAAALDAPAKLGQVSVCKVYRPESGRDINQYRIGSGMPPVSERPAYVPPVAVRRGDAARAVANAPKVVEPVRKVFVGPDTAAARKMVTDAFNVPEAVEPVQSDMGIPVSEKQDDGPVVVVEPVPLAAKASDDNDAWAEAMAEQAACPADSASSIDLNSEFLSQDEANALLKGVTGESVTTPRYAVVTGMRLFDSKEEAIADTESSMANMKLAELTDLDLTVIEVTPLGSLRAGLRLEAAL